MSESSYPLHGYDVPAPARTRGRTVLSIGTAASTALSIFWLSSSVMDRGYEWRFVYLTIPLAAVAFAVHPRSTAFYRAR